MATSSNGNRERKNYIRLCCAIIDLGTGVLRNILNRQIKPSQLRQHALGCRGLKLNASQLNTISTTSFLDYKEFDISLLYILIRKLCTTISPTNGWNHGYPPIVTEINEGDDVERIHYIRNKIYGHLSEARVSDTHFEQYWRILQGVMTRMDISSGTDFGLKLANLEASCIDTETEEIYLQKISELEQADKELRQEVTSLKDRTQDLEGKIENVEKELSSHKERISVLYSRSKDDVSSPRLSQAAEENQARTLNIIKDQSKNSRIVCTKAVDNGLNTLEKSGFLIFTGTAGSGKTTNSIQVMRKYKEKYPDAVILDVNDFMTWESYVSSEFDTVVLFDDFLGSSNINKDILHEGRKHWRQITACHRGGKLRVILTTRIHILQEALCTLEKQSPELFRKETILDLSSDNAKLSHSEKVEILEHHFRNSKIVVVDDFGIENFSSEEILNEDVEVRISQRRLNRISKAEPLIGFPQACSLFCSFRKYTRLGEKFFVHPSQNLREELDRLCLSRDNDEKLQYCILAYMLIANKKIDLDQIDEKLLEEITASFSPSCPLNKIAIRIAVARMRDTYILNIPSTNTFKFKHETILEALALSLGTFSKELILKVCNRRFLREFVRTKQYPVKEDEVILMLNSEFDHEYLIKRFMSDFLSIQNDHNKYWWVSHPAFNDSDFVASFIRVVKSDKKYEEAISSSCQEKWGIFMYACINDMCILVQELYTHFSVKVYESCLRYANISFGSSTTEWLLDRLNTINWHGYGKVMDSALEDAPAEKLNAVIKHPLMTFDLLVSGLLGCQEYRRGSKFISKWLRGAFSVEFPNPGTVKIILDRWPHIETKYIDILIEEMRYYGDQRTIELLESVKIKNQSNI